MTANDESFRAFVSLDVDAESCARVAAIAKRLRADPRAPRASWSPTEKMHVTVKFFAQIARDAADALGAALPGMVVGAPVIHVPARDVSAFPSPSRARVVIVPLDDRDGRVAAIADAVADRAFALGYAREERAFKPHVTLARAKHPFNARAWLASMALDAIGDVALSELVLYKSELGPNGATHTPLVRVPFR